MPAQKMTEAKRALKERTSEIDEAIAGLNVERERIETALASLSDAPAPAAPTPSTSKSKPAGGKKGKAAKKSAAKAAPAKVTKTASAVSAGTTKSPAKQRRKRRGGTRSDQAMKLITAKPGLTGKEIAIELKIKPNYIYRIMTDLEKDGRVAKVDSKYYAPGAEPKAS
jgi:hypothetical protein